MLREGISQRSLHERCGCSGRRYRLFIAGERVQGGIGYGIHSIILRCVLLYLKSP